MHVSTVEPGAFRITNNSPDGQKLENVRIDLGDSILPDMVFDPAGTAGDSAAECLQPASGAGETGLVVPNDPCLDPFSEPRDGGYEVMELSFNDFDAGETFTFSVDVDPTSIKGVVPPGPNDSGGVSGLELTGTGATFVFDDGTVREAETFRVPGSLGGSKNTARANPPAQPTIEALGTQTPATVAEANQTIHVSGPAGAPVSLMVLEAGLFTEGLPNGGYDISPYDANSAVAVSEKTAQIGAGGTIDIPVTLTRANAESGLNYMLAVIKDASGRSGPNSNVVVLELDESSAANEAPVLDVIGNQSVEEGSVKTVNISASDPDGDPLTLSAANLPGFASFCDTGGGKGALTLSPKVGDAGSYQVTVSASDGKSSSSQTFGVSVIAAPQLGYGIKVSKSPDRASFASLNGATVSGNIYPFTSPDAGVKQVAFYLDNQNMRGSPNQVENFAPYDFAGGSVSAANPFKTTNVANGPHTITAKMVLSDNTTTVVNAAFTVDNVAAQSVNALSASAESLDFEDVEVGKDEARSVLLTNTGAEDVTINSAGTSGANAGQFSIWGLDPVTLSPDESVAVEVGFTPREAGRKSANVEVNHDRSGSPLQIQVSGNGTQTIPPDTTKPSITNMTPRPNARTTIRRPTIKAVVRDDRGALSHSRIRLFVDGRPAAFTYNPQNGLLTHRSRLLPFGRHVARVVAVDNAGNAQTRAWSFVVVKGRR